MENAIECEQKDTIEQILRTFDKNDDITIENVDCLAGCKDGDNYMSVVKRIIVHGKYNDGLGEC